MYNVFCYVLAAILVFAVGLIPFWGVGAFLAWDAHWMSLIPQMSAWDRVGVALGYVISLRTTLYIAEKIEEEF